MFIRPFPALHEITRDDRDGRLIDIKEKQIYDTVYHNTGNDYRVFRDRCYFARKNRNPKRSVAKRTIFTRSRPYDKIGPFIEITVKGTFGAPKVHVHHYKFVLIIIKQIIIIIISFVILYCGKLDLLIFWR